MSRTPLNLLLIGANRGIGLELATQFAARGDNVTISCRHLDDSLEALPFDIITDVDITTDAGLNNLKEAVDDQQFDGVFCIAGLLEKVTLDELDIESIRRQFEVNALAPLRVAALLKDHIKPNGKLALMTSRMGSIEDNGSGGSYGYRMSKTALNAAGKSLAIDLAEQKIAVALLHPGYVRTRMTQFNGLMDSDESAKLLIERFDGLNLENSGSFWHANGELLPW
ncbi:SDR family oxidoreductase [Pleionea sp. CnH1-48]|uniref:SDR family oxidoreductase n=1 Tax=Pleionea sp. CnH1-48 TaxID=2954494 RepID=UPI002096CC8A|nr:SDR family oxidoreductase [Pleionea sp. CnH1-48]MCO7224178.1 SDR family oxidoreductase [Pleionea sp. CnH1-48]